MRTPLASCNNYGRIYAAIRELRDGQVIVVEHGISFIDAIRLKHDLDCAIILSAQRQPEPDSGTDSGKNAEVLKSSEVTAADGAPGVDRTHDQLIKSQIKG